ncbi:hypothetical protein RB195_019188 [Necator americanus]|uniref:Uncharacterized protein n=1 Tax=Necator americanus TaxID=51031 RepID=A0ABR1CD05_NECAM
MLLDISKIYLVLLHDDTVRPTLTGENVPLLSDKSPVQVTPSLLGLPDGKGKSIILNTFDDSHVIPNESINLSAVCDHLGNERMFSRTRNFSLLLEEFANTITVV